MSASYHWTPDEFRRHGHEAVEWVARYLETIEDHPVQSRVEPGWVRDHLPASPPASPEDFDSLLEDLDRVVVPGITHWQHPHAARRKARDPGVDRRAGHHRTPRRRPLEPHRGAHMTEHDIDPRRFEIHRYDGRGFSQAYVRENAGGVPLLCVHGWPETKRIWWRVIEPLAAAGFDVIVPDLRGFGDSDLGPDGLHDVAAHVADLHALLTDGLGLAGVVLCGGDLGGPVIQSLALEHAELTDRMILFNSPLPYDKERMAGMDTRPPTEAADYFVRQGLDADGLAADLTTPEQRRRYIASFYSSRFWAHPGAFLGDAPMVFGPNGGTPVIDFHTEPFGDAARLRASFGGYESVFDPAKRSGDARLERNEAVRALLLFGPSDHVIYPAFDEMAAVVFPDHDGPHRLDACGHFVQWEAADALVAHTERFCADRLRAPL